VLRDLGLEAAGVYQAAWTLGGMYIGFILQALGADFYPRLVGVITDHQECNRVVNEQAHVSLLLAAPGVIATITFAPLAIYLFYSAEFSASIDLLRWICLGMAMRIVTWPLGYIIVAKSRQMAFFGTDAAWAVANVGLTWLLISNFGVNGAGIAFFSSYILHAAIVYPLARNITGFRWSGTNTRAALCFGSLIATVFVAFHALPAAFAIGLGMLATVASGCFSIWALSRLASPDLVPPSIRRLLPTRRV
jgi:antigen flippase